MPHFGVGEATTSKLIEVQVKRAKAFEMRAAGKTTREIAAEFGVVEKTIRAWIMQWKRNVTEMTADEIKTEQIATLKLLLEKWEPKALGGEVSGLDQWLKIDDRLARYLGLYAPTKIDAAVQHSETAISRQEMREAVMNRLKQLEEQKNRLTAMDAQPSEN